MLTLGSQLAQSRHSDGRILQGVSQRDSGDRSVDAARDALERMLATHN
jgi:hypothetical protein